MNIEGVKRVSGERTKERGSGMNNVVMPELDVTDEQGSYVAVTRPAMMRSFVRRGMP
jgi:hypothetical protein